MRTIKFEYGFSSVNGIIKKQYYLHEIPSIKEKCDVWNVLPIAYVRQFTGIHDKNGKEIYEGDILNVCNGSINGNGWFDKPYSVEFKCGKFDIPLFMWDKDGQVVMDCTHWCEVIGNIYENPELLTD